MKLNSKDMSQNMKLKMEFVKSILHILQRQNFGIFFLFLPFRTLFTLRSGIVALVGIIVLVGTFAKINKRTGGNKRISGPFY